MEKFPTHGNVLSVTYHPEMIRTEPVRHFVLMRKINETNYGKFIGYQPPSYMYVYISSYMIDSNDY